MGGLLSNIRMENNNAYYNHTYSPAIDHRSVAETAAEDWDGEPSPGGVGYDIGADNWWMAGIYLLLVSRFNTAILSHASPRLVTGEWEGNVAQELSCATKPHLLQIG